MDVMSTGKQIIMSLFILLFLAEDNCELFRESDETSTQRVEEPNLATCVLCG